MTTINVSNSSQLQSALSHAAGGDTIVLAAGNYGTSYINDRNYSAGVTIKSASLSNRAHFDYLAISNSNNLRFEGLDVGHALRHGENPSSPYARVTDSDNIKMVGMSFHGSLDNHPANDGVGLNVTNSDHFQLMGSTFRDLYRGAYIQQASDVTVASNSFQMIRTDGLDFGAVNGAVVDKNSFTNFHPIAGDHADAIQFWLTGQPHGSSNIAITNNTIMQGSGTGMQGIFMSDPKAFGYNNVRIQNNLVYGNDQYHGIFLNGVHGAQVIGNTMLSKSTDHKMMWIDLHNGSNFTVRDNLAESIQVQRGATGVSMSHNATPATVGSFHALFPHLDAPTSVNDLITHGYGYQLPGSISTGIAPVATALGQSIGSMVGPTSTATSAQVSHTVVAEPTHAPPTLSQVFPSAPHVEMVANTVTVPVTVTHQFFMPHFNHFVAMV
ncbi:hypothetical protein SCH01S_43_00260 [Sphingomonas changbaiensis NBRC 104936]|uniref:Right handed beta helix domain-containing protein n=1 Tax=Sphingomonas changbaiensis NBRC 104936 TaxID=1219043 RepID=A0A0E9MSL5_9SPHN|nr:right-handed parallel beta-helix repeat-containing protein [Sphingomonas changbaiensis]GAO40125.1 hypothetical protein SCH01S_43_00260 [Sphingomonas changbaiensis NBRC 104936]